MAKASTLFLSLLAAAVGTSCCGTRTTCHLWASETGVRRSEIEKVLRDNPLQPNENVRLTELGQTESVSHYLAQVRVAEPLHIHRTHDLTVFGYRGTGLMTVGANRFEVGPGDILFIPRGVSHRLENLSREPAVAVVAFSPRLAEKDFELVSETK